MKHLYVNLSLFLVILSFSILSCEKDEEKDSCSDGVQSIEEEGVDCGGSCPPCEESENKPVAIATVRGTDIQFSTFALEKEKDWVLFFGNDTISITINLGDGDSLGVRPLKAEYSKSYLNNVKYEALKEGKSLFEKIDHNKKELSFYLEADFGMKTSEPNYNSLDSLKVTSATFRHIPWN